MRDLSPPEQMPLVFRPLRVVPDANVFTGRAWVDWLLEESEARRIDLYWSPKIIEELSRVRLWIWIKQTFRSEQPPTGSSGWKTLWSRYSQDTHAWFARVSPHIRAIEDRPPHETAWIEPHPDPNDAWLWNTARRSSADCVLTVNLSDAPPSDAAGSRHHEGIIFMHPRAFMPLLTVWNRIRASGVVPRDLVGQIRAAAPAGPFDDAETVAAQIRALLARMADETRTVDGEAGAGA